MTFLGNISQSLYPVQRLITGVAYLLGIIFFITAIEKFKKLAESHGRGGSHESAVSPIAYLLAGAALLYLPSTLHTVANTAFGVGNVLTYPTAQKANVYQTVGLFIRTAGIVWFIRGAVLMAHASQPGEQHGVKGFWFLIAGVFAINFDNTVAVLNNSLNWFINVTMTFKAHQGY